ncbi:hypothetical protein AB6N24_16975 [Cellulomonas sp. 179-A 4D5 NHS]|uniref:hypothetical protein n=1 Tax=Cellulomonas sp. 179-A 4D5 NHS TaxID=3142378 RepID=UPI00399F3D46
MTRLPAYDLVLVTDDASGAHPAAPALWARWAGAEGPAIDPATWPRSPRTGQPLVHDATVALPEPYRRTHPDLVAVALVDWSDEVGFLPAPPHARTSQRRWAVTGPGPSTPTTRSGPTSTPPGPTSLR